MGSASEAKAVEAASLQHHDTPPAYTAHDAAASSFGATPAIPGPALNSVSPYEPFPSTMYAYYTFKITRTFHLGSDDSDHKLFAVSNYVGFDGKGPGKPSVVLHNGPSPDDLVLAIVGEEDGWMKNTPRRGSNFTISLPPLNPTATRQLAIHGDKEVMYGGTFDPQVGYSFRFTVETTRGGGLVREDFEWRKTTQVEGDEYKYHYELVRLGTTAEKGGESGAVSFRQGEALALVAFKRFYSLSKPFKVEFVGSSMTDLGPRWAVTAVVTGVWVWALQIAGRAD
ncbi:hypothetical protein C8035_v009100 [Colletotrichum spinosum]|uniref:Uncharacterized protein n=1 Tax=Colletotrichum spinosum TaxID=1347390 RepID=A0A4R8PMX8_9PEZI|nr:hypothetical protein C8035_v009100 [Colletotrichum spinosum]